MWAHWAGGHLQEAIWYYGSRVAGHSGCWQLRLITSRLLKSHLEFCSRRRNFRNVSEIPELKGTGCNLTCPAWQGVELLNTDQFVAWHDAFTWAELRLGSRRPSLRSAVPPICAASTASVWGN